MRRVAMLVIPAKFHYHLGCYLRARWTQMYSIQMLQACGTMSACLWGVTMRLFSTAARPFKRTLRLWTPSAMSLIACLVSALVR